MSVHKMRLPKPTLWQMNVEGLRRNVIIVMALMLIAMGALTGAATVNYRVFPDQFFFVAMGTIALGLVSLALSGAFLWLARVLFITGSSVLWALTMSLLPAQWLPFAGVVLVVINAALATGGGLLSAVSFG